MCLEMFDWSRTAYSVLYSETLHDYLCLELVELTKSIFQPRLALSLLLLKLLDPLLGFLQQLVVAGANAMYRM